MIDKIGVLGGGAWGTALANVIAKRMESEENEARYIDLYVRSVSNEVLVNSFHEHGSLKEIKLSKRVRATHHCQRIGEARIIFVAVPLQNMREALLTLRGYIADIEEKIFILCSKGIEIDTSMLASEILVEVLGDVKYVILSGPNFAKEVASGDLVRTVLASHSAESLDIVTKLFDDTSMKVEKSNDVLGVQVCGALKNIFAIGSGIIEGLGMGKSSICSYVSQCVSELASAIVKCGGDFSTTLTPAGIGDVMLTCQNIESRNYKFGCDIAKGKVHSGNYKGRTVEGYHTAASIMSWCEKRKINMPICEIIYGILYKNEKVENIRMALHI